MKSVKRDQWVRKSLERETDTDSRILPHPALCSHALCRRCPDLLLGSGTRTLLFPHWVPLRHWPGPKGDKCSASHAA